MFVVTEMAMLILNLNTKTGLMRLKVNVRFCEGEGQTEQVSKTPNGKKRLTYQNMSGLASIV